MYMEKDAKHKGCGIKNTGKRSRKAPSGKRIGKSRPEKANNQRNRILN